MENIVSSQAQHEKHTVESLEAAKLGQLFAAIGNPNLEHFARTFAVHPHQAPFKSVPESSAWQLLRHQWVLSRSSPRKARDSQSSLRTVRRPAFVCANCCGRKASVRRRSHVTRTREGTAQGSGKGCVAVSQFASLYIASNYEGKLEAEVGKIPGVQGNEMEVARLRAAWTLARS